MRNVNEDAAKHLIIENPFTGKQTDILPLLKISNECFSGFSSGDEPVSKHLDDAIRILTTSKTENALAEKIRFIADGLYSLRDAFIEIIEFNASTEAVHK
jgi:hypothetical protein